MRLATLAACSTPHPPSRATPHEAYAWSCDQASLLVSQAAAQGADVACLPETFATSGAARAMPHETLPDGPTASWCADLARRHRLHLIAPLVGLLDGVPRNAALWFDCEGTFRSAYSKVHLTTPEMEQGLVPGNEWTVFEMPLRRGGTLRAGAFICYDLNFPETARLLALRGAEVLFHPTVYSMYGESGWEAVLRARAIDNCVYVCTVNHGIRDDVPWMPGMALGRSGIVGPDGLTLAETGRYAGVAVTTVDLDRPRLVRSFGIPGQANFRHELWRHRRPETYGEIASFGRYVTETGATPAAAGATAIIPGDEVRNH